MSDVAILYLGVGALFTGPVAIGIFGRWIYNRANEQTAAATFDRDFIPTADDVAATERDIAENEMCALLDEARDHVEGLLFAAELAEWEASA